MPTTSARKPLAKKKTPTASKAAPAKKTPARKSSPAAAKKTAPAKKTTGTRKPPVDNRERGIHGYAVGTDTALIADALIAGGSTRDECNANAIAAIAETSGLKTRGGKDKYIPSMAATVISDLVSSGKFRVESSWRLVPIDGGIVTPAPAPTVTEGAPKKAPARKITRKKPGAAKK